MAELKAQIQSMTRAHGEYLAASATAKNQLNAIQGLMASLQWTGGAASTYQARMAQWGADYQRVIQALDRLTQSLQTSITSLSRAEESAEAQAAR